MNHLEVENIIDSINRLTNGNPFNYLKENSTWFSEALVSKSNKNCYPYMSDEYNDFFFNNNITKLEKDICLKFIVNRDMKNEQYDVNSISLWIIKIWGGIKVIKEASVSELIQNVNNNEYPFDKISSWSKINSFQNIETDIIYDSKVIYSLNWLLLLMKEYDGKYFHQPMSRNNKLTTFPIDIIVNYRHNDAIDLTKRGEKIAEKVYYPKEEVYKRYRQIIHSINDILWGDMSIDFTSILGKKITLRHYPFFTEILLFTMADDIIVKDIRKKVFIDLK